jgi:CRISPR-associated endonuclease/helicase Cas3
MAADFARPFGGEEWAWLAGQWHDLGKFSDEFQRKLNGENFRVVHSEAGGHLAQQRMSKGMERIFCWLIMGHHAGLADYGSSISGAKALETKMRNPEVSEGIIRNVPEEMKRHPAPAPPKVLLERGDVAFFIRMLFSCLLDADFLDTEAFMDKERGDLRKNDYPSLEKLLIAFDRHMAGFDNAKPSKVNQIRAKVLRQCREVAESEPAVFSLTVPTGGGKTLSSLAFALRHAVKHGKRRVVYVIPYTSIIEQTAAVFRRIPGFETAVLEHHSNMVAEDENRETMRARLATENWDAPIIVTTSVQFFESLYACKTSRCRKLHNIVESVVIFDEAQCLPPKFLRPAVFAIRELHRHYGVTPVLCTATQPVLDRTESFDFKFKEGFESVVEIIKDPASLTHGLKRVRVERFRGLETVSYDEIAQAILAENQSVLCIVNRKKDARTLTRLLPDEQTLHLSTNMCAEHRFQTLEAIRLRLKSEVAPLFVISTSLVEAGVDLDFPVVYRALAGLDSVAQAAGRCNREGRLPSLGKTVVFIPEHQPVYVQSSASLAYGYLKEEKLEDLFLPDTFRAYFKERFFQLGESALDDKNILELLGGRLEFSFRTAAERFQLIDDDWQRPLVVPFGDAPALVDQLLEEPWSARRMFRRLQRYTISIPEKLMRQLLAQGHARELLPDYPGTVVLDDRGLHTDRFGFITPDEIEAYDADFTIV